MVISLSFQEGRPYLPPAEEAGLLFRLGPSLLHYGPCEFSHPSFHFIHSFSGTRVKGLSFVKVPLYIFVFITHILSPSALPCKTVGI